MRPAEKGDGRTSPISVGLAGNQRASAAQTEGGEITMPGEPLLPMGRTVRRGSWSFFWGKQTGPQFVSLSSSQERAIKNITNAGQKHLFPTVEGDIPYLSKKDSEMVRDRISLTRNQEFVSYKAESEGRPAQTDVPKRVLKPVDEGQRGSFPSSDVQITPSDVDSAFLGCKDEEFRDLYNNSIEARNVLLTAFEFGHEGVSEVRDQWSKKQSQATFIGLIDDFCQGIDCWNETTREKDRENSQSLKDTKVSFGSSEVNHYFTDAPVEDLRFVDSIRPVLTKVVRELGDQALMVAMKNRPGRPRKHPRPDNEVPKEEIIAEDDGRPICPEADGTTTESFLKHCLTHEPARRDCQVCQMTKRRLKGFERGSATKSNDDCLKGGVLLTFDWANPTETSSDGAKYLAVVGYVDKGCAYTRGYKVKTGNVADAVHEARVAWGIEHLPFTLHTDNERVVVGTEMKNYLRDEHRSLSKGGFALHSAPKRSNTNARAEAFVKTGVQGIRALIQQAGIPTGWWNVAAQAYAIEAARRVGIEPRFNSVEPVPFGTLGMALLPTGICLKDKFTTRTNMVAHLGVEPTTSGAVKVLYSDSTGALRRATILNRDVKWCKGTYALPQRRVGLRAVGSLFPGFEAANQISRHQAQCETCRKWRFVDEKELQQFQDKQFVCSDLQISCEQGEDERVWQEFADADFPDCSEQLQFVDHEDGEIVMAKRLKVETDNFALAKAVREEVLGGLTDPEFEEYSSALMRLGTSKVDEGDIERLRMVAMREERAQKDEHVRAFQVVVTCKDALREDNPDRSGWVEGIESELESLFKKSGVLRLIHPKELVEGDEVLPSMLVLTQKPCGRKKARLVACGNFQKLPASEAYCGVVGHDGWLQNIIMGLRLGQRVAQIDVSTAFLQTDEQDDDKDRVRTILRPPKTCPVKPEEAGMLWEVTKSIYGLRSAPAAWKATLVRWLTSRGFSTCDFDENVLAAPDGTLVLIYVDDLLYIGSGESLQQNIAVLKSKFDCTDEVYLDEVTKERPLRFLGHLLWIEDGHLMVDQSEYASTLVKRFQMDQCAPSKSLKGEDFDRDDLKQGEALTDKDQSLLRKIVGGVQYLAQGTRPDLCAPVAIVAEGQSGGTRKHLEAGKRLIRYIHGSAARILAIPLTALKSGGEVVLRMDFDASFSKSYGRTGLALYIDEGLCFWSSKRQRCVTLSTAESELVAATAAGREVVGTRNFLRSLWGEATPFKISFKLRLRGDNQAANLIASRQASLRRVRHLCLSDLYIRQITQQEDVCIEYVRSDANAADILTKVQGEQKVSPLLHRLCIRVGERRELKAARLILFPHRVTKGQHRH